MRASSASGRSNIVVCLVAPMLACLLHPFAGPIAALLVVVVLGRFDRAAASGLPTEK